MERIYFEKLKSNIPIIKSLLEQAQTEEARTLLMNSIDVDGAVLLLYRNLGEAWAELADLIQKTQKDLKDLSDRVDQYHDELNEKIDEVNNYLMRLIRALEDRIDVIEQRLDEIRDFYIITGAYDEKTGNSNYHMKHNGERIYLADVNAAITAGRTPVFIYTESVGVKEVYYFCKQSGSGTSVTFESIQTRFNSDTSEYETFNGKWTTDGNFIHFSKEDLQLKLTAGENITILGNVISADGGGVLYVEFIYDEDNQTWSIDQDPVEVGKAIDEGTAAVIGYFTDPDSGTQRIVYPQRYSYYNTWNEQEQDGEIYVDITFGGEFRASDDIGYYAGAIISYYYSGSVMESYGVKVFDDFKYVHILNISNPLMNDTTLTITADEFEDITPHTSGSMILLVNNPVNRASYYYNGCYYDGNNNTHYFFTGKKFDGTNLTTQVIDVYKNGSTIVTTITNI